LGCFYKITNRKLGDKLEYIINIVTFGRGKAIATWIANKLGYEDCGCDNRKEYLNNITRNGRQEMD